MHTGENHIKMTSLAKAHKLRDDQIFKYLVKLPNSQYKGVNVYRLSEFL